MNTQTSLRAKSSQDIQVQTAVGDVVNKEHNFVSDWHQSPNAGRHEFMRQASTHTNKQVSSPVF